MKRKDLVLIGGGHTHVLLIKAIAMRPISGVRVTLVSEQSTTPYSGMLPGYVAGHYDLDETNIDLNRLCRKAGVRWIRARVDNIHPDQQFISLEHEPEVYFDALSVDIGSTPDLSIKGAGEFAVGVKPISGFQQRWRQLLEPSPASSETSSSDWGVVGAGAGGVELVLAMAHRMRDRQELSFHLIYNSDTVLPGYPAGVIAAVEHALQRYKIHLHPNFKVAEVTAKGVVSDGGNQVGLDTSIWCTGAVGAHWLEKTGLSLSDRGFINVLSTLQSVDHPAIFAVGDIAEMVDDPRPKAGVFAVRQAPHLERNLRAFFAGDRLTPVSLQTKFLSLLALGNKTAVASRNGLAVKARWVWRWKNAIDQKFMRQFADMKMTMTPTSVVATPDEADPPMHCGGCASKLGPDTLMANLTALNSSEKIAIEDAAVWQPTPNTDTIQTIDGFRALISDESRFAQICVNHALSDLYAMGATPRSIQSWINLEFSAPVLQQRDHLRVLQAINKAVTSEGAALLGGHSSEGAETHIGIVANGELPHDQCWSKSTPQLGDLIVLSKPLGTGIVMAADMQGACPAKTVDAVIDAMLQSNLNAMNALREVAPSAVTDVTGFGLLGHLLEMLDGTNLQRDRELAAELDLQAIPIFEGVEKLVQAGWRSSLYPQLEPYLSRCSHDGAAISEQDLAKIPLLSVLLDPQTGGGLLATIDSDEESALLALNDDFTVVGRIVNKPSIGVGASSVLLI